MFDLIGLQVLCDLVLEKCHINKLYLLTKEKSNRNGHMDKQNKVSCLQNLPKCRKKNTKNKQMKDKQVMI